LSIQTALQKEDDFSPRLCNFPLAHHNEGPRKREGTEI